MSQDFSQFPPEQRAAYLGVIASLTTADRRASEEEVEFLSALAQQTGLAQQQAQTVVDAALDPGSGALQKNLAVLRDSELKYSLLHDLLAYAQSDGNFSIEEQRFIESLASSLGISHDQYRAVDNFQRVQGTGGDVSEAASALRSSGVPAQSNGFLGQLIASLGPLVLQQILSRSRRGATTSSAGAGGGLMDILGSVLGGAQGGGRRPSGGGLSDILGSILGAPAGGRPQHTAPPSSGFGGLGQILEVLGSAGGGQQGQTMSSGSPQRTGGSLSNIAGTLGRLFGGK